MTTSYKVLGQSTPALNIPTTLYTVPSGNYSAVVSTLTVCNQSTATTFRVAVVPSGQSLSTKNYINYDTPIPSNDTIALTLGMTLASNDSIIVTPGSGSLSFSAFGSEIY